MSAVQVLASSEHLTWPDTVAMAVFLAFLLGVLWLLLR